jgi:dTDP-4-amino-4,6-dideoxygalactose transaminase
LVFCDSCSGQPNIDVKEIESKITSSSKAIILMHYAGISCDMDEIIALARKHNLYIIEDAALGLGSRYKDRYLGSIGDLGTFSFHQTKNITCGEGGLLAVNHPDLISKAEIIWEKGTNRAAFLRGESDKYEWVSKGSSFLTSEIHAAFLYAQLEEFDFIHESLVSKWNKYHVSIHKNNLFSLPEIRIEKDVNGSIFYLVFTKHELKSKFMEFMNNCGISVATHYRCLHNSKFFKSRYKGEKLKNSENISETLVRLPLFVDLTSDLQNSIIGKINEFIKNNIE